MKTIRLPSRLISPLTSPTLGWPQLSFLTGLTVGAGCFVYYSSAPVLYIAALLVCVFCCFSIVLNRRELHRLELLANSRPGESICNFARSFDKRLTDTWVIRAAYQEIQLLLRSHMAAFPVRASDSLLVDLRIDPEDVEDLLRDIAERSAHTLVRVEENPLYGKVNTVMDLVLFINAQPGKI